MRRAILLFLLFSLLVVDYASAQQIPNSARAERLTKKSPVDKIPDQVKSTKPKRVTKEVDFIKAPAGAEKIKFKLNSIVVTGLTAYKAHEIKSIYKNSLGQEITLQDLYDIANAITYKYHEDGYIFSKAIIPAQAIESGDVKIKIHEGSINSVQFKGFMPNNFVTNEVKKRILAMKPLDVDILESEILKLNDLLGVAYRTILKPSSVQGKVDLVLIGEKLKNQLDFSFNNNGSKFIGPLQYNLGANIFHSSLLPFNETSIDVTLAQPLKELAFVSLTHKLPVNSYGTQLTVSGSYSKSEPGHTLTVNELETDSYTGTVSLSQPILRSRARTIRTDLSFEVRNTTTDILNTRLTEDKLRTLALGVDIENYDDFQGVTFVNLDFTQGLGIMGASKRGDQNLSRASGNPKFSKFEMVAGRLQSLGSSFALLGTMLGQFSDDSLLSSEEIGFGGKSIGKAYDSSEITGDKGIMGSLELRYYDVPDVMDVVIQPYAFYDIGHVWHNDQVADRRASAASAGGGVRLSHMKTGLSSEFIVAQPLTRNQSTPIHSGNGSRPRYIFELGYSLDF